MKASIVDLRYRMKDVLRALDRNEEVTVTYRGEVKGVIVPSGGKKRNKTKMRVEDHPLFGSAKSDKSVEEVMNELRDGRYRDL
jgi:antitoxin (DNA-binding transcriptional repressor) of toxin-antitoxin stability system